MSILTALVEGLEQAAKVMNSMYTSDEVKKIKNVAKILARHGKDVVADQLRDIVGDATVVEKRRPTQEQIPTNSATQLMTIKQELIEQKNIMSFGTDLICSNAKQYRIRFDDTSIHIGATSEPWNVNPALDLGEYVCEFQNGLLTRTYCAKVPDMSTASSITNIIEYISDVIVRR